MKAEISHFTITFTPPDVMPKFLIGWEEGASLIDTDDIPTWYGAEMCSRCNSFKFRR